MSTDSEENGFLDLIRLDRSSSETLERQLTQQITRLMAAGRIQAGQRLPPIRELASHLGINQHTVRSAYLRLQDQGLVEARRGHGTVALVADRANLGAGASRPRSFAIGVILPAFSSFYRGVFDGIARAGEGDPAQLLISHCEEDPDTAERYLRQFIAMGVDGILVISQQMPEVAVSVSETPIVYGDWPGSPLPSVLFDASVVSDGVEHLAEHGHQQIAIICPPERFSNMAEVLGAYGAATDRLGLKPVVGSVEDFSAGSAVTALADLMNRSDPPTAVITASESLAQGVYAGSQRLGLAIPDDLAVISFGGTEAADGFSPQLTAVELPTGEMGEQLMETLLQMISGDEPFGSTVELESHLIVRSSCGPHD